MNVMKTKTNSCFLLSPGEEVTQNWYSEISKHDYNSEQSMGTGKIFDLILSILSVFLINDYVHDSCTRLVLIWGYVMCTKDSSMFVTIHFIVFQFKFGQDRFI